MTGIITSLPPLVEQPPGNNSSNPAGLPGVTYTFALLQYPQTWTAKQTFPLGNISLNAADILGLSSSATIDTTNANNITGGSQTGTGALVRAVSPSFTTPILGAATATSLTSSGAVTINPTAGTTNQGLVVSQTGVGGSSAATGVNGSGFTYNLINIPSDKIQQTGTSPLSYGLQVYMQPDTGSKGQKAAFSANINRIGAAGDTGRDTIGATFFAQSFVPNNGTNTGAGASGTLFGASPGATANNGAINLYLVSGGEVDVAILTGASSRYRLGWSVVDTGNLQAADSVYDAAFEIGSVTGSPGFKYGLLVSTSLHGAPGVSSTGTLIGTDTVAATVGNGIDFSAYTITGNFLKGPNSKFLVNGAGNTITLNGLNILLGSGTTTPYNNILDTSGSGAIVIGGGGTTPDPSNYYRNTQHLFGSIGGATPFMRIVAGATGVQFNQYGAGILHSSAAGVLSSSAVSLTADVTGTLPVANGGTNYTGGAWTAYTAAITPAAGAITTQSSSSAYLQIGKIVFVRIQVTVSNIGTGSGVLTISLPVASTASVAGVFLSGREAGVSGKMLSGIMPGGTTTMNIANYDNTAPTFSNGVIYNFNGTYEST